MSFASNLLLAVTLLGGFVSVCSVVHRKRLHNLFAAAISAAFIAVFIWAVTTYALPA